MELNAIDGMLVAWSLLATVHVIAAFAAVIHLLLLNRRLNGAKAFGWLALTVLLPLLGPYLYYRNFAKPRINSTI